VWFVPLADISDTRFICRDSRRSEASGCTQPSPQEQVIDALAAQPALLLLDNFEQLVEEGTGQVQNCSKACHVSQF
jgi:hypothetical protein